MLWLLCNYETRYNCRYIVIGLPGSMSKTILQLSKKERKYVRNKIPVNLSCFCDRCFIYVNFNFV